MSCTTILAGKFATNDRSTMIARTDDGLYEAKKLIVVGRGKSPLDPESDMPAVYKSVISHVEIPLPEGALSYTASPAVDPVHGIWASTGINEANVGITATETITSNPRVLGADPLVVRHRVGDDVMDPAFGAKPGEDGKDEKKEIPGGIGEEDIVVLVLPYIRSAREGILRLASLLEEYGTYESNGIAINDENEVWWLETIGGHHWMARKVPDEVCVVNPNQFGMDYFDMDDAFGEQKEFMCSADLKEFIADNHLDLNQNGIFNPRDIFGSRTDSDHVYNTPRAWFMGRYLTPYSYKWDGPDAEFTPESDNIPWSFVPDRKVTVEDIKYLLSSHYQGTPYDPYSGRDTNMRGMYRSIGINRTIVTSICQIRSGVPDAVKAIEWIIFGSCCFSAVLPLYSNVSKMPEYVSNVTTDVSTENFYWASRLIGALADSQYVACIQHIERYHNAVMSKSRRIINEYDRKVKDSEKDAAALVQEANEKLCAMAKKETVNTLNKVVDEVSRKMKNGFNRADN